jgi:hypothetical protein
MPLTFSHVDFVLHLSWQRVVVSSMDWILKVRLLYFILNPLTRSDVAFCFSFAGNQVLPSPRLGETHRRLCKALGTTGSLSISLEQLLLHFHQGATAYIGQLANSNLRGMHSCKSNKLDPSQNLFA